MAVVGEPLAAAADTRSMETQERPREGHAPMVMSSSTCSFSQDPKGSCGPVLVEWGQLEGTWLWISRTQAANPNASHGHQ